MEVWYFQPVASVLIKTCKQIRQFNVRIFEVNEIISSVIKSKSRLLIYLTSLPSKYSVFASSRNYRIHYQNYSTLSSNHWPLAVYSAEGISHDVIWFWFSICRLCFKWQRRLKASLTNSVGFQLLPVRPLITGFDSSACQKYDSRSSDWISFAIVSACDFRWMWLTDFDAYFGYLEGVFVCEWT